MNEIGVYSLVMVCFVFLASFSQILLKKSANSNHKNIVSEYFNPRVLIAYSLFMVSAVVNLYLLRFLPISLAATLESLGYVFVAVLSFFVLKERLNLTQVIGIGLILVGVCIFALI